LKHELSSHGEAAEEALRTFEINKTKKNAPLFPANEIKTSKYTVLNFLPKNLAD
jgi:hypothetical protein